MNRIDLISYSLMYDGECHRIVKAIQDNTEIPEDILTKAVNVKNAITIFDKEYPNEFLSLRYAPMVVYYKGNIELLKEKRVGIVGSRMPIGYSLDSTKSLCYKLNSENTVVVSGLAKGIDAEAHTYAQKSIGILGCGIDYIYPQCNEPLFHKLENCGLILSEYPENTKPLGYHFPFRNRLISALSETLYVMECHYASGTQTTIKESIELGRKIKVLPQLIGHPEICNNKLIAEGAMPILDEDVSIG